MKKGNPYLELVAACRIGKGIQSLPPEALHLWQSYFDAKKNTQSVAFFIPASGSGSRMFEALYHYISETRPDEKTLESVEQLFNSISDFAFYDYLPENLKQDIKSGKADLQLVIRTLLYDSIPGMPGSGFNYANLPKGLIPFHRYESGNANPFQEHVMQGLNFTCPNPAFHFTVNQNYRNQIAATVQEIEKKVDRNFYYQFSEQNAETDAIAFDANFNPVYDEKGQLITRPAGHGALLDNLNTIDADLIFVRNIDNIQHQSKNAISIETRKALAGILIHLKAEVHAILTELEKGNIPEEKIKLIEEITELRFLDPQKTVSHYIAIFNRPIRVCGMVKNEGQPGGGPFWVKNNAGEIRPQIVEKSQISETPEQLDLLVKATHFNPVEMVCATRNYKGELFDLKKFRNDDLYFIVRKTHQGKPIQYVEEPGLWNGGMDGWLTVFFEIESACFSPVKTVLDLLKAEHRGE